MLPRGGRGLLPSLLCQSDSRYAPVPVSTRRSISTLDPTRITSADYVDLSGRSQCNQRFRVWYANNGNPRPIPFPDDTHGFSYYRPGPEHAPIAGEVRFRVTSSADPSSFGAGRDLLLPSAPEPWKVHLFNVLKIPSSKSHFRSVLLNQHQLVSGELVASTQEHKMRRLAAATLVVHSLGQPILMDLSRIGFKIRVASGNRIYDLIQLNVPIDSRKDMGMTPYIGTPLSMLCRIRRSLTKTCPSQIWACLEDAGLNGMQGFAIRVLEIIEPVVPKREGYDGWIPAPIAGELLRGPGGDTAIHYLSESTAGIAAFQALLKGTGSSGYIRRWSPQQLELRGTSNDRCCIRNLDPATLAETDWMDLSLLEVTPVRFVDTGLEATMSSLLTHISFGVDNGGVFPPATTGFFYVHVPDRAHPIGAQLRFRVVAEPNPAVFAAGRDLQTPFGTAWYRWLPGLIFSKGGALASLVACQGLVDASVVKLWQTAPAAAPSASSIPLSCPGADPLVLNLEVDSPRIVVGAGTRAFSVQVQTPFCYQARGSTKRLKAFKGDDVSCCHAC
jgi:hypothetical protein